MICAKSTSSTRSGLLLSETPFPGWKRLAKEVWTSSPNTSAVYGPPENPKSLTRFTTKRLALAGVEIRFVFGIPAVWGEDAASRIKEAINKSHVLQLPGRLPASVSFIAEPEAAAIAVLPRAVQSGRLKVRLLSRRALPRFSFPRTCSIADLVARGSPPPNRTERQS